MAEDDYSGGLGLRTTLIPRATGQIAKLIHNAE
jgi:hypothetical protein